MIKITGLVATIVLALAAVPALAENSPPALVAACRSSLDAQPRIVRKEAVQAIDSSADITVVPFCMGIQYQEFGNAAGLGKTIASNPVLAAALSRYGFRADDVTSIVIVGRSVRLYVHRD